MTRVPVTGFSGESRSGPQTAPWDDAWATPFLDFRPSSNIRIAADTPFLTILETAKVLGSNAKMQERYETKRHRVRGVKRGAWRGASFPLSPRALAGGSSDCAKFVSKLWATGFVTRGGYLRSDTAPPRPRCASFLAFFSARFLESGSSQPTSEQPGWPFHHPSCLDP